MTERAWPDGLPGHEVEALSRAAFDSAKAVLPCTCGTGHDSPHHNGGCPAIYRSAVASAIFGARTHDRRRDVEEAVDKLDPESPLRSLVDLASRAVFSGAKLRFGVTWDGPYRVVQLSGADGSTATFRLLAPPRTAPGTPKKEGQEQNGGMHHE